MRDRTADDYHALIATRRAELLAALTPLLGGHPRITLEIGCGHGHFLTAYASAHPQTFCLGIDIASDRVRRGDRKRDRARLQNLAFLHADAADLLAVLPAAQTIETTFILFPDPWPKKRHHKNRLMQSAFLTALARFCAPHAGLYFRTDHEEYFAEAAAVVARHPDWRVQTTVAWPFEYVTVFQARARSFQSLVALRAP